MVQNDLQEFTIKNEIEDVTYYSYCEEQVMLQQVREGRADDFMQDIYSQNAAVETAE